MGKDYCRIELSISGVRRWSRGLRRWHERLVISWVFVSTSPQNTFDYGDTFS